MATTVITALASAARTATGTVDLGAFPADADEINIYLNVTVVSGTSPSRTATYQCSPDGVTYYDHTAGAAITAAGNQVIKVATNTGTYGRISYAISGTTPSFTFSAVAENKNR